MSVFMAIRLFQHRGMWYVELDGKRRSLRTKDKQEARRLYSEIRKQYLSGKLAHLTGKCTTTLGEFVDEYLQWAEPVQPRSTFRANRLALDKLIHYASRSTSLDRISPKHADQMISDSRKNGLSTASASNYLRHMRACLNKAVEWGHIQSNPLRAVREIRENPKPPSFLDAKEIPRFLASIQDTDLRRLVVAYLATGRRRKELLALTWEDVDDDRYSYRITGKGGSVQWHPINGVFRSVLDSIGRSTGRIFSRWEHPDTVSHYVRRELKRFGTTMHLHHLRHTFASLKVMEGVDIRTVQDLLGHKDIKATMIYAHLSDEHIRKSAEVSFGPIDLGAPNPLRKK